MHTDAPRSSGGTIEATTALPERYPGMADRRDWRRTEVHQHSRYRCLWCGYEFAEPLAVYHHLDRKHSSRVSKRPAA